MNNLMIFENKEVEVFEFNGQVLFNPKDVAKCLGIANVNDNLAKMNDRQVVKLKNSDIGSTDIRNLNNAGENFLTESGVYKLIFKSRKAAAERFQDWVTDEVLPEIRKTGSYEFKNMSLEDLIIKQAQSVKEVKQQLNQINHTALKVKSEVKELREESPLFNIECDELQNLVKSIGIKFMGKGTPAYNDNSLRSKVYADIQRELRRQFNVKSYKAIKRGQFKQAKEILMNYNLPICLKNEIQIKNRQYSMCI